MLIINVVKAFCLCYVIWCVSVLFFACLTFWWPDLDVMSGAWSMTAMFAICGLTAIAVEAADHRNT